MGFPSRSMMHKQRRALDTAIRGAHLTIKSIASALSISTATLRRYRKGHRPVPGPVLASVASLLRYQAERLTRKAAALDELLAETKAPVTQPAKRKKGRRN